MTNHDPPGMNYLAHFHLAGRDPAMIHGALLGDFVKGPLRGEFDSATEQGISLHRKIDAFSDGANDIRQARRTLPPEFHRYAGIITDVVFDFFLSRHWQRFHHQRLDEFAASIYQAMEPCPDSWPEPARRFSRRLMDYDLLCQYGDWTTVERVLDSIASRLSRPNPLGEAAAQIEPLLDTMETAFLAFYPSLQNCARDFLEQRV